MNNPENTSGNRQVDPMFDGHLEHPFEELTPTERLEWLWQVLVLRWNTQCEGEKQQNPEQKSEQ